MRKFIKAFRYEIIAVALGLIFFIVFAGSPKIREVIKDTLSLVVQFVRHLLSYLVETFARLMSNITLSEVVGVLALILALTFVIARIRYRYRSNTDFDATVCPVCASQIKRVHRNRLDRLLSKTLLPGARRYRCVNPTCGWSGLRHQRYRPEHHFIDEEPQKS